jgi:PIN domain nuclease of toxin-antitoxin system
MTLLLDTHAFLWFCQGDAQLSAAAKALIEDPSNRKLVSIASCWEIAIKVGLGKLTLGEPSGTYIPAALARTGFDILPISPAHATAVESLPMHHRDPFDR